MSKNYILIAALIFGSILPNFNDVSCQSTSDEDASITRILFVLDASSSMRRKWEGPESKTESRWNSAIRVLASLVDSLNDVPNLQMGLRVYGHQSPSTKEDCSDSKLEIPIKPNMEKDIKKKLANLKPKGITPLAYSLEKAGEDFPKTAGRNVIIILTDGEESCGGDPCKVAYALQKSNAALKPFVIGVDIPEYVIKRYSCIGHTYNSLSEKDLKESLNVVVKRVVSRTSLQVNLLDESQNATETDVNMTFYDLQNGIAKYNFYHALNKANEPDTISIDPVHSYRLVVHTVPPVIMDTVRVVPNEHNKIYLNAGQGTLSFNLIGKSTNSDLLSKIKAVVKLDSAFQTLYVQDINSKRKYLTGTYDVELLTLPRIKMENVVIRQSDNSTITIPHPGLVNLSKTFDAYGGIFVYEDNRMKKIYEIKNSGSLETVALQPGTYRLIYRHKFAKSMHSTIDKEFTLKSGDKKTIKL